MTKTYTTNTGAKQFKPSLNWIQDADNEGFCLACGNTQSGIGPYAHKCKCKSCGALKVYGSAQLLVMNLYH